MSENEQKHAAAVTTSDNKCNDKDNRGKRTFIRSNFKGANESIATLCTRAERKRKDQYIVYQKSFEQYVTTTFSNPGDILPVIRDLADPMRELMKNIPKRETFLAFSKIERRRIYQVNLFQHTSFY